MNTTRKLLYTLGVVALAGTLAGSAVFSAFSSTTTNSANSFAMGSVTIGDNDADGALYSLSNQKPGVTTSKCIKVTFTGTLGSTVKLHTPSTVSAGAQYVNLTITPGTQATSTFPSCTGFNADAGGAAFTGTVQSFATAHGSVGNGLALNNQSGSASWATNDAVVYKFDVAVQDNNSAQGATSGSHDFVWRSENQ
jgi:hypothetical protein